SFTMPSMTTTRVDSSIDMSGPWLAGGCAVKTEAVAQSATTDAAASARVTVGMAGVLLPAVYDRGASPRSKRRVVSCHQGEPNSEGHCPLPSGTWRGGA